MAVLLAPLLTTTLPAQVPDPAVDPTFTLEELAPGVHAAVVVPRPPQYAFANSLVVDLGDGLLVVDTQASPGAARALIAELVRRWTVPVRWVVNTHWHGDHVLGNAAYRNAFPGVRIIGHTSHPEDIALRTRAQVDEDLASLPAGIARAAGWLAEGRGPDGSPLAATQRANLERSLALRRAQLEMLRTVELVPPDLMVADSLVLAGPARHVHILAAGPAHTRGDLVVWLPRERILAAGDLLEDAWPWVDGADIAGWARTLGRLASLGPATLLPAHGRPWLAPGGRLAAQRAVFEAALSGACPPAAAPGPPGEVARLAGALGLAESGAPDFWRRLLAAAATSAGCRAPGG